VAGIKSGTAQTSEGMELIVMSELLSEFDNHEVSVYACMFVHGAPCFYIAHDFYNVPRVQLVQQRRSRD
jgi:hypothetical protein